MISSYIHSFNWVLLHKHTKKYLHKKRQSNVQSNMDNRLSRVKSCVNLVTHISTILNETCKKYLKSYTTTLKKANEKTHIAKSGPYSNLSPYKILQCSINDKIHNVPLKYLFLTNSLGTASLWIIYISSNDVNHVTLYFFMKHFLFNIIYYFLSHYFF